MLRALRLAVALVVSLAAASAGASRIEHFFGTLQIEIIGMPPLVVTGEGFATLDASQAPHVALSVPSATLAGSAGKILITPYPHGSSFSYGPGNIYSPLAEEHVTVQNGPGLLVDGAGRMALRGHYKACLFFECSAPPPTYVVDVPLTQGSQFGVGLGGTFYVPRAAAGGLYDLTVVGAPWTTGAVTVTTYHGGTAMKTGFVRAPGGGSGFESAAQHGGEIQMVSPFAVYLGSTDTRIPGMATFRVTFAPEPETIVLLGLGVAALAVAGRRSESRQ